MINQWTDVDGPQAESQLRGLRRRLAELDAALAAQQGLIRQTPSSFAMRLGMQSLQKMEQNLRSELHSLLFNRAHEKIDVVLNGPNFAGHSARISDLGIILTRFQRMYSSIAQALQSGPRLRGPIPYGVARSTELRIEEVFASSFGMGLFVESRFDMLGNSLASSSLENLFQLLESVKNEKQFMDVAGALGRRSLVHLRHLAGLVRETESEMAIYWTDYAGTKFSWGVNNTGADSVVRAIDNISQESSKSISVIGWLVGASLLRGRFEVVLDNRDVIEGKFVPKVAQMVQENFGNRVIVYLDETKILDMTSGEARTYHIMNGLEVAD